MERRSWNVSIAQGNVWDVLDELETTGLVGLVRDDPDAPSLTLVRAKPQLHHIQDKMIMQDIWEAILGARVLIADCTNKNANVFYEKWTSPCAR